jgi:copper chaperone NosL
MPHAAARISVILLSVTLLLVLIACGGQTSAEPAPPVIHYGEDICEFCGMIISEERYAAGYITGDGEERIFDDLGGMFQAHLQKQEEVAAFFVHDYEDTAWIRAETAYYVLSQELPTPMLSGLAACASSEKAEALAAEFDGEILTFDEVLAHYRENSPMAAEAGEHHHD